MTDFRKTPTSTRGYPKIDISAPEEKRVDIISVNWCDRTTWYPSSTLVEDEVLTDDGDATTFSIANDYLIDVNHGKITGERKLRAQYSPTITVDGYAKTENSPDAYDGDYTIDYDNGQVIFNSALVGDPEVLMTYYYETGSSWTIAPDSGKVLRVTEVEVQFSAETIVLTDTVVFQAYGFVDVFAPQLMPGIPSGTKIPIGSATYYQTMQDYINDAQLAYPNIPQMGGSGWRAMKGPIHIFRWHYKDRGTTDLVSSYGMEIRIKLENDMAFTGDIAVATFYGTSEDE